jgi:hypothetical protein
MQDCQEMFWARNEFRSADFGDIRRTHRLVKIAASLALNVGTAISMVCGKMSAQLVSRFFARAEVTVDSVLQPHIETTVERCAGEGRIFAVQDTTHLDYGSHYALEGLGPIGKVAGNRGLLMHTVLAVTEEKVPLGILGMNLWARDLDNHGNARQRRKRPIEDKDSYKWLIGLEQAESAVKEGQKLLVIGDRGSDIYELFAHPRRATTDLLVRSNQNRTLISDEHRLLLDAVSASDELGRYFLDIPRQGSRPHRRAEMVVRSVSVTLKRPYVRKKEGLVLNCVCARELNPPGKVAGLEWILLTSLPVETLSDALYVLDAYSCRWVIEEFHKVLKSGCKVERLQFEKLDSLLPAIALLSVVACRVLYLTKESRRSPDADVSQVSSPLEREVLEKWLISQREKRYRILTLQDFVRGVAILGGFMARKHDGNPGPKVVWQGLKRLEEIIIGYSLNLLNVMKD